jgi:hypothetical protein
MYTMVERVQNSWWVKEIKTADRLRSKWPELAVKLCPANLTTSAFGMSKPDTNIPKGFRG